MPPSEKGHKDCDPRGDGCIALQKIKAEINSAVGHAFSDLLNKKAGKAYVETELKELENRMDEMERTNNKVINSQKNWAIAVLTALCFNLLGTLIGVIIIALKFKG